MVELLIIAVIAIFAGLVKGISGFGSSLVTIPLLIYFIPIEEVVVMMLTFNVVLNTLLLVRHKGFSTHSLSYVWPISLLGIVGTFIGLTLLESLGGDWIKIIAGTLILFAVINRLFHLHFKLSETTMNKTIVGLFSGLGNGIASIDGPPVVFYLTSVNANKIKFKNTLAFHFLVMGIIAVIFLIIKQMYTVDILLNTAYFTLFASLALLVGVHLSNKMNEQLFQRVILVILVFLAISMYI
ncbi:MAG: sulfite exporter TauE/SafE family protein [Candidatus Izemoplasma sp.]|nr:sulfite exporter TauE/SafE family protein [Candidatus Izemoplasma sp.]